MSFVIHLQIINWKTMKQHQSKIHAFERVLIDFKSQFLALIHSVLPTNGTFHLQIFYGHLFLITGYEKSTNRLWIVLVQLFLYPFPGFQSLTLSYSSLNCCVLFVIIRSFLNVAFTFWMFLERVSVVFPKWFKMFFFS